MPIFKELSLNFEQGPQNHRRSAKNYLKSLKIQYPIDAGHFHPLPHQRWLYYQILGGIIVKKRKNRYINNGDIVEKVSKTL